MKNIVINSFSLIFTCLAVGSTSYSDDNLHVAQRWCVDGTFQFLVEQSGPSLPGPMESCFTISSDGMQSAGPITVNRQMNTPVGNFVDYILKYILGTNNMTYRDLRMPVQREYLAKVGSCGSKQFFAVDEIRFPYLPANNVNPARDQCQFGQSLEIKSDLPLAGVYLRENGQSLQNFVSALTN
jgi:hypothetical protein